MGLASVAVYSECDRAARYVRLADEAVAIGPSPAVESYLRADRLIDAALRAGADALHPGYGFLSERPEFAAACRDAGLTFIGPPPEAMTLMGSKTAARQTARAGGVPVVPGSDEPLGPDADDTVVARLAVDTGFPLLIKAVAGGGGKGMRAVSTMDELPSALRLARAEALAAFGDASVYLERQLERVRHVEVQVLADRHGRVVPFVERECSIQRRHQKVIEETPSPAVTPALRRALAAAAEAVVRAAGYVNAGTVEFLLEGDGRFYFLEMNTRLQVEHPVTEAVTGVDLVTWQIRIARGERLELPAEAALTPRGHAIECRIYAEDPDAGFVPSPGRITALRVPDGPGVRHDVGVESGSDVPMYYDPLLAKLIVWGPTRPDAIARMRRALREYDVRGIGTTVPFFRWMLGQDAFVTGAFHTGYLDAVLHERGGASFSEHTAEDQEAAAIVAALMPVPVFQGPAAARRSTEAVAATPGPPGGWVHAARLEALRS
jgi:acetyl-CoA carboxylase biotin carboxylase subunit